ncbi:siderophore-interacting protein [Carnimonas bestiolae]|uniref:siderophore-interacting protein n=1 Tax=Carnimonas bestiolae TaxID=3402172 RepID=UPI003EDB92AB
MISNVLPITRQCSSKEQKLLRALRAMNGRNAWPTHAGYLLADIGVDSSGIYSLARLMQAIERDVEDFELLGPKSQFVSRDELNLLAALGQPLEVEEAARTRARIIGNEQFGGAELIRACAEALERAQVTLRPRAALKSAFNPLSTDNVLTVHPVAERRLRKVHVVAIEEVTPRVRRVTLGGDEFEGFAVSAPAQWVLLFLGGDKEHRNRGRIYTIRTFDPALQQLTLDITLNDDGETSQWVRNATAGDEAIVAGPRGGFVLHEDEPWLLLAGDESALASIIDIISAQPAQRRLTVFIEVGAKEEIQTLPEHPDMNVEWLIRGQSRSLMAAIQACATDHQHGYAWVATEAATASDIRQTLTKMRGFGFERTHVTGYWKQGEARFKDIAAG